jgi:predicted nucleic acid-binding protein
VRVYLDSSVVLRVVLGEKDRLVEWSRISEAVTSEITRVECLRILDRMRIDRIVDDRELVRRRGTTLGMLTSFETVRLNRSVLDRAADPFPTRIRTLDAVHLATALIARPRFPALRFATHDADLGAAAVAEGFLVLGVR